MTVIKMCNFPLKPRGEVYNLPHEYSNFACSFQQLYIKRKMFQICEYKSEYRSVLYENNYFILIWKCVPNLRCKAHVYMYSIICANVSNIDTKQ